ncbi:MAG TPA: glycosyltransferase family 2 protein, partial [Blastocatellia bacterium]|nr:glycosyltransferase family 2 protein [Blastocatellia bacterium]
KLVSQTLALLLLSDSILRASLLLLRAAAPDRAAGPESNTESQTSRGCVVLIAAHNEAGTIGPTVTAFKEQLAEWPGSSLWVAADRCSDQTALEAALAGAKVAERPNGISESRTGKCAVIGWWLSKHEAEWRSRDAILILDADSRLVNGSLRALRRAMAAGGEDLAALQSFVAPDASASAGRLAGWSEVLMQRIDDEARRRCGWSVPLRGTGMAFRGDALARIAPRLTTLAEDLEMDVLLASERKRVEFVPEAMVLDPKPRQSSGASRQRARWFQGQLQVLLNYPREIVKALAGGGWGAWFLLPLLMLRPKILFIGLRSLLLLISIWFPFLFWIALAGLAMDASYYLWGATLVDNPRRYLIDLLTAPRYAAMWLYGFGIAIIRRDKGVWLRSGR